MTVLQALADERKTLAVSLKAEEEKLWLEYKGASAVALAANERWSQACTKLREFQERMEP